MSSPEKESHRESICQGSCEDYDIICMPCYRDNIQAPAFGFCQDCNEHLCKSCFTCHKKNRFCMNHTLLDENSMPQQQHISEITEVTPTVYGEFTKPCSLHCKEIIKYYCKDHNALVCEVCETFHHPRTHCKLTYIPHISGRFVDSKEYNAILAKIETMKKRCQDQAANLKMKTEQSNTSLKNILGEIEKFRKDINKRLDELERMAHEALDSRTYENDKRLKGVETVCNDVIQSLQTVAVNIQQYNKPTHADLLFIELKTAEQLIRENEKKMIPLTLWQDIEEFYFEPNLEITKVLEQQISLGKVTKLKSRILVHKKQIRINTAEELEGACLITGMTSPTPGKLLIADYKNKSIKMIECNNYSITGNLKLNETPWDITAVSDEKVAVTLPFKRAVQLVSTSSNKLTKENLIKVEGSCHGITFCEGKLVVSFREPAKVQVYDMKGKKLSSFATNTNGVDIFREPKYIAANSRFIYVSDSEKKGVIKLNWQGRVIGFYKGSGAPEGIDLLDHGSFLLSDGKTCNVKKVSEDCTSSEIILEKVKRPLTICWCETSNCLFMASFQESADNFVQMFKMSPSV